MSDTFDHESAEYAAARPHYPDALFAWLAETCTRTEAAWDCATGNGQAAIGLARHFRHVEATDSSAEQIAEAFPAENVRYSIQLAERTSFAESSFDLVAVAQALHWLDYELFWPEVRRVGRRGALFCAWGYAWFRGPEEVDQLLLEPVCDLVEPYWAKENRILWNGYAEEDVGFPFQRIAAPELSIEVTWPFEAIAAYVRTWSAFRRAVADNMASELERVIGTAEQRLGAKTTFSLRVPITMLAGLIT